MYDPFETMTDEREAKLTKRQREDLNDYVEFALDEILHNIGPRREKIF